MKKKSFQLPALVVSAKRSVWRMHDHADEADKEAASVRAVVLGENNSTCQFCDLWSSKYQEMHHIDDDHKNNRRENLSCACPLCHQVFHLGMVGMKDGGDLIYLPEMTQAEVNQLALVTWIVSEAKSAHFKDPQQALLCTRLAGRAKVIEALLAARKGTVFLRIKLALKELPTFPKELIDSIRITQLNASVFANVLKDLPDELYEQRSDLLGGLRLLPSATRFRERILHWSAEQASVLPIPSWYKILDEDALHGLIESCSSSIAALSPNKNIGSM